MALATATVTFDLSDMLGVDFDARRTKVWTDTNIPNDTIIDTDGNQIRLGTGNVTIAEDGTGTFTTWVPGAGANPATWQTTVHVDYPDRNGGRGGRGQRTFGPFTITASANLADLEDEQAVPPEYLSLVTAQLDVYIDSASASATNAAESAALAQSVAEIDTPDALVETLIETPSSLTATALSATIEAEAPKALGRVNVVDYGVVGNNVANDTTAFVAAIAAAIAQKRTLWVPPGLVGVRLTTTVDARYIDILAESPIRIAQTAAVGLVIGDHSNLVNHRKISLISVSNTTGPDPTYPSVRVTGLKGAIVTIGNCDYLQLYADQDVPESTSVAYNKFHFGRTIRKHELLGVNGVGWINENTFYGGSIRNVIVSGTWKHDSNLWHKTSIENPDGGAGASIVFNVGAFNRMEGVRGEAGVPVTFAAGTYGNVIVPSYGSNLSTIAFYGAVTDDGTGNTITGYQPFSRMVELVRVDANAKMYDACAEWNAPQVPVPGSRKLITKAAFGNIIDTGLIPLDGDSPGALAGEVSHRLRRFILASDVSSWQPYVTLYDANRQRIDVSVGGPYIDTNTGWTALGTSPNTRYGYSGTVAVARLLVTSSTVKFIRFEVQSPSANVKFSWLSLSAQLGMGHVLPGLTDSFRRGNRRPLYQTTSPSKGAAYPGEKVANASGFYTATSRWDTTTTAALTAGATVVPVAAFAGGWVANDVMGLLLDDDTTHWAKVVSVSSLNVTIDTALPSAAASGRAVVVNRWA